MRVRSDGLGNELGVELELGLRPAHAEGDLDRALLVFLHAVREPVEGKEEVNRCPR